jgi:hypothetical protein
LNRGERKPKERDLRSHCPSPKLVFKDWRGQPPVTNFYRVRRRIRKGWMRKSRAKTFLIKMFVAEQGREMVVDFLMP